MTNENGDDLIELSLRLPRDVVERSLVAARSADIDIARTRLGLARRALSLRLKRASMFPGLRFGEAVWDMILDLYIAAGEGRRVDVSSLCYVGGVPTTTGLRHIDTLIDQGYITREPDVRDARRAFINVEPRLINAIESWLDLTYASFQIVT